MALRWARSTMKIPSTGELRNPLWLYRAVSTPDSTDGMSLTLTPTASVFAYVKNGRGAYLSEHSDQEMEIIYDFLFRKNNTFTVQLNDLILYRGNYYQVVQAVDLDQYNPYWLVSVVDTGPMKFTISNVTQAPETLNL